MKECTRCGLCCILELCSYGRRIDKKKKGNCKFLIRNSDNTTSCELIINNKINKNKISFAEGCTFQENYPIQYEFYTTMNVIKKEQSHND
jgi:hypothetical protein